MDGLPIWAKVGDLDISDEKFEEMERAGVRSEMRVNAQHSHDIMPENRLLYTHRHFTFGVNNDQIVEVNMTASDPQLVHVNEYRGSSPHFPLDRFSFRTRARGFRRQCPSRTGLTGISRRRRRKRRCIGSASSIPS